MYVHFMKKTVFCLSSFSLIFLLIFNGPILLKDFLNYKSIPFYALLETLKSSAYIMFAVFGLFFGLSINRYLFILTSLVLFLISCFSIYYIYEFGLTITPQVIKVVFYDEIADGLELISIKLVLYLIFVLTIWILLSRKYIKELSVFKPTWYKILSIVFLLISINFLAKPPYKLLKHFLPWQTTNAVFLFFNKPPEAQKLDISENAIFKNENNENLTTILVIGEGARYDHFGINGYELDTTPLLAKEKGVFSFDATSCASMTYLSVSCMLSRHSKDRFNINSNETTIISLFNKIGFQTSWFGTQNLLKYFENQLGGSFYDEAKTLIIPGGSALYQMNDHDEVMLPLIEDYLKKDGSKFIIIHTVGSHWDYAKRYPKEFEKFNPGCRPPTWGKRDMRDCSDKALISIYDNSILYTDFVLSKIIDLIRDKNSFMIYVSDHGQSLGENGIYAQGGTAPEQFNIPFIFWGSEKYYKNNKNVKEALAARKNNKISHDYVFHSLLGCSNIDSPIIDQSLNICSIK